MPAEIAAQTGQGPRGLRRDAWSWGSPKTPVLTVRAALGT